MKIYIVLSYLLFTLSSNSQIMRQRTVTLMGSHFDITIVAQDSATAENHIDAVIAEVDRIENLISDWRPVTQISEVNKNAGIKPIKVDPEVFALTERAIQLSTQTRGAFDISFAAMDRIWKFDGSMEKMPTPEAIKNSVTKVGYKNIRLNRKKSTIFLRRKGMKIGFGALGEGYAADKCRKMMLAKGVPAGIVNGSGDMNTWGTQPNGNPWTVGLTDPKNKESLFAIVPVTQGAVVTSGSYEKFVMFDGIRYSHIINPKTGYPASGLSSVTVFGPSAEVANGFSTAIMVLGKEYGIKFLQQYPDYSGILVTDGGMFYTVGNVDLQAARKAAGTE